MNHVRASVTDEGCHDGYKLQFDFSKFDDEDARGDVELEEKEDEEPRSSLSARLGPPSASAGYQLAIRALIAFECNVAENFIWARHEGASKRDWRGEGYAEGRLGRSGSRCDFVSTLRTPSRALRSPFRRDTHNICTSTACFRARSQSRWSNLFMTLRIAALW